MPCLPWRSPSPHAQIARWAPVAAIWGYDLDALIAEREEVQKVLITADVLCVPREA